MGLFQNSVFAHTSSEMAYPVIAVVFDVPGQQGQSLFFFANIDFIFRLLLTIQLLYRGWHMFCKEISVQLIVMKDKIFFFKNELAS